METYKIADHVISVDADAQCWQRLKWHYEPFAVDTDADRVLDVTVREGRLDSHATDGLELILSDKPTEPGMLAMDLYQGGDKLMFVLQQPYAEQSGAWVSISRDYTHAEIVVSYSDNQRDHWRADNNLTSSMMLAYMLATCRSHTLLAHAACIKHDGRAYLFIAKSGTGKSTHARLWLKNIAGSTLLNDDHPIVRITDGKAIAYGSPWSGKTDCYICDQAPIGAIVRISRATANSIEHLSPLAAYASLASSFSGMTMAPDQAEWRHQAVESLIKSVPCFTLHCLPDDEAAIICHNAVAQ